MNSFASSLSTYPALNNIPFNFPKSFRSPQSFSLPFTYQHVPDNITDYYNYDFTRERTILSLKVQELEEEKAALAELEARKRRIIEMELEKKRQIAPGYADDEGKVLQPLRNLRNVPSGGLGLMDVDSKVGDVNMEENFRESEIVESPPKTVEKQKQNSGLNFSEFEQGLAAPEPWDQVEDDLTLLKQIMGVSQATNTDSKMSEASASYSSNTAPVTSPPSKPGYGSYFDSWFPQSSPKPSTTTPNVGSQDVVMSSTPPKSISSPPPAIPQKMFSFPELSTTVPTTTVPKNSLSAYFDNVNSDSPSYTNVGKPFYPDLKGKVYSEAKITMKPETEIKKPRFDDPEQQGIYNNMVSMGFPEDAIVNSITKHKSDDKKVLERLLAIGSITSSSKNYTLEEAETVLEIYEMDDPDLTVKADHVIGVQRRVEELGFDKADIRKAVIEMKAEVEFSKVVDKLMG